MSQSRVDAMVAAARATVTGDESRESTVPLAAVRPVPVASKDPTDLRISEELQHTRRLIEALGDKLANDPILLVRYQSALQSVDLMAQTLGHLACVVGAADKQRAIDDIGMGSLRARLSRNPVTGDEASEGSDLNSSA